MTKRTLAGQIPTQARWSLGRAKALPALLCLSPASRVREAGGSVRAWRCGLNGRRVILLVRVSPGPKKRRPFRPPHSATMTSVNTPHASLPPKPARALDATSVFFRERAADLRLGNGESEVLDLFHQARARVPAYAKFLSSQGVDGATVQSFSEFRTLPITNKRNYHTAYPLPDLCKFGRLEDCDMLAVSSGSTGEPTVWPRFISDEVGSWRRFEQVLVGAFGADEKRTLTVVCFALGSWVGGMFTTSACRHLAAKGYPITVVTPGNNISEILRVVPKLAPFFDQVVLLGYPPFLKDVLDRGANQGVNWAGFSTKLVMAGEVFSESWRDLVASRLGQDAPELATASLYGTADGGVLANETPASVLVRRALSAHPTVARELFGQLRLPTLCQYDPCHRFFEQIDGELIFSGDGGIPLIRYNILDRGGVIAHHDLVAFLRAKGLMNASIEAHLETCKLPFVYVFGRNNFAVSYYGANVFPENISIGLEQPSVERAVTGKFVLEVAEDERHDSELRVTVELVDGQTTSPELARELAQSIQGHLAANNSEFANYVPKERQLVVIRLLPQGESNYFPSGVKHRYTR